MNYFVILGDNNLDDMVAVTNHPDELKSEYYEFYEAALLSNKILNTPVYKVDDS